MTELQRGDAGGAVSLIEQAIQAAPRNPAFHANLAQALIALRRVAEARAAFQRAAELDPRNPQFATGAASCVALSGDLTEAERQFRAILGRHPGFALAWLNLGNAIRDQRRPREAEDCFRRAIELEPGHPDAHNGLGGVLHALGRLDEAERAYRQSLILQADAAAGYINLASLLIDRGRTADAANVCRQGIERCSAPPDASELQWMLGSALAYQGDFTSASVAFRAATAAAPDHARALWGYGLALLEAGSEREALRCLERALELQDTAEFRHAMAGVWLSVGNMQPGWREYRQRPARAGFLERFPGVRLAEAASGSLAAKRVLLLREQGLGDELFFLRFAARLKARGPEITYCASSKIASMLERVPALDRVIADSASRPAADCCMLVGDLPHVLGAVDFPPPLALAPLPRQLESSGRQLAALGPPPYIGVTWRAGTAPEQQRGAAWLLHKDVSLERLGSAVRDVKGTLLALQRNPQPGEVDEISARAGRRVHDVNMLNEDLEAMLAVLALIDEYVGVSNTNMHLRAGAGRTARVLVPRPAEWRWMKSGDESPWFPGFRIYRQGANGDWGLAFERLTQDLVAQFGARR